MNPSDEAAPAAAEAASGTARVDRWTLSNGIVLSIRPVPPKAMRDAAERVPQPEVPKVWNPSRERDEENPDDPRYQEALTRAAYERTQASLKVALILGTSPLSLPEGMYGPDASDWEEGVLDAFEALGEPPPVIRPSGAGRYLDWLHYYALTSDEDYFALTRVLLATTVVTESEVQRALESFRDQQRRLRDLDAAIFAGGVDGDRDTGVTAG